MSTSSPELDTSLANQDPSAQGYIVRTEEEKEELIRDMKEREKRRILQEQEGLGKVATTTDEPDPRRMSYPPAPTCEDYLVM